MSSPTPQRWEPCRCSKVAWRRNFWRCWCSKAAKLWEKHSSRKNPWEGPKSETFWWSQVGFRMRYRSWMWRKHLDSRLCYYLNISVQALGKPRLQRYTKGYFIEAKTMWLSSIWSIDKTLILDGFFHTLSSKHAGKFDWSWVPTIGMLIFFNQDPSSLLAPCCYRLRS